MIPACKNQYRIRYKQCSSKGHEGESLNFVCLNPDCAEKSLICSMCRSDQHRTHVTQPLKYYIEILKKEYEQDKRDFESEFDCLEEERRKFLLKLKEAVEKVAEQFRKLEEEVVERFDAIRAQIIEQQSKRNKFTDFYDSLVEQKDEKSEFLIRNYLPAKKINEITNIAKLDKMDGELGKIIYETKDIILNSQKIVEEKPEDIEALLKMASTIKRVGNIYSQTNQASNSDSLSILNVNLLKEFGQNRIKIKVTRLKKGGTLTIGAIRKDLFDTLKHKAPNPWNNAQNKGKVCYYNNMGQVFGQQSNTLKTFSQGSNMELQMNGESLKIKMRKNWAEFKLEGGEFFFFFNLTGSAEIEIKYLNGK